MGSIVPITIPTEPGELEKCDKTEPCTLVLTCLKHKPQCISSGKSQNPIRLKSLPSGHNVRQVLRSCCPKRVYPPVSMIDDGELTVKNLKDGKCRFLHSYATPCTYAFVAPLADCSRTPSVTVSSNIHDTTTTSTTKLKLAFALQIFETSNQKLHSIYRCTIDKNHL